MIAWAKIVALLLSQVARGGVEGNKDYQNTIEFVHGLAGLSLDKRIKIISGWYVSLIVLSSSRSAEAGSLIREASQTASEELWERFHALFIESFVSPKTPAHVKALAKLKGKQGGPQLPPEVAKELFEYDGFLLGLGKMSLSESRKVLLALGLC